MHSLPDSNRVNVLSLPIKVGMWWRRGLLCQPWPASISLLWLCGGGASQAVLSTSTLSSEQSHVRDLWGSGGHDISQSTKPLPLSSEEHNRAKWLPIQHRPPADSGGPCVGCRMLPRPSYWSQMFDSTAQFWSMAWWLLLHMQSFHHQPATLLGPDYPQPNQATWGSFNAVPPATCRRAPSPAPGAVLWFWHPASSWVPAPSHGLIMRLNWWFSLIFASFDVLNPIRKAYLIRASCTWHIDPHGRYLGWTPPGLILPRPQTLVCPSFLWDWSITVD